MLDYRKEVERVCHFIGDYCARAGFQHLVIGLSGGIDSALSAALAVRAMGKENVHAYNIPYRNSHPDSAADAALVASHLQIDIQSIDISPMVDSYFTANEPHADTLRKGNWMARIRMNVLYDQAAKHKALVVGTGNLTELMVGYCTQYGDSACAFEPIGHLYKTEVWEMARHLGLPDKVITKTPTADLWDGQSDEAELGISYPMLDAILEAVISKANTDAFPLDAVTKVKRLISSSAFKRSMPPAPERV